MLAFQPKVWYTGFMKYGLNIKVEKEVAERLKELKKITGRSITFMVDAAIREYLDKKGEEHE